MDYKQQFLTYMVSVRGYSALSAKQYGQCLVKFEYWLALSRNYDSEQQISGSDFTEFIMWCHDSGLQAKTINLHRTAVSSYFNYCVKYHGYQFNPVLYTSPLKEPHRLPECIEMEVVEKALARLDGSSYDNLLKKAMVLVLCHGGLRAQELCDLQLTSWQHRSLSVVGKGNKARLVPISERCDRALLAYMAHRQAVSPYLFVTKDGRSFTRSMTYKYIHNIFIGLCSEHLAHPHALRHTFATYCLVHGVSIPQISAWLGHNSYATTMRYLSVLPGTPNPFDL